MRCSEALTKYIKSVQHDQHSHVNRRRTKSPLRRPIKPKKRFTFTRRLSASRTPSFVIGPLCCIAGASDSGGFGGGKGCSNGAPCEGCIEVVEGTRGAAGADVKGGGTKNDGFIRVARTAGAISEISKAKAGAKDVFSGKAVVVGEIIDGMGIGASVGEAVITVRDCTE